MSTVNPNSSLRLDVLRKNQQYGSSPLNFLMMELSDREGFPDSSVSFYSLLQASSKVLGNGIYILHNIINRGPLEQGVLAMCLMVFRILSYSSPEILQPLNILLDDSLYPKGMHECDDGTDS